MPCQRKDQKQSLFCEKDLGMTNGSVAIIPSAKKKKKKKKSREYVDSKKLTTSK